MKTIDNAQKAIEIESPYAIAPRYVATPDGEKKWRVPSPLVTATIAGLAGTAWIHAKAISEKYAEVPYLGVGYALLVVASIIAGVMIMAGHRRGWQLAVATCAATIIGFVLTRTVGLPASTDDIGNWGEPAGIYALVAEGVVVVCGAAALALAASKQRKVA